MGVLIVTSLDLLAMTVLLVVECWSVNAAGVEWMWGVDRVERL